MDFVLTDGRHHGAEVTIGGDPHLSDAPPTELEVLGLCKNQRRLFLDGEDVLLGFRLSWRQLAKSPD
jgi:hypothetical protein